MQELEIVRKSGLKMSQMKWNGMIEGDVMLKGLLPIRIAWVRWWWWGFNEWFPLKMSSIRPRQMAPTRNAKEVKSKAILQSHPSAPVIMKWVCLVVTHSNRLVSPTFPRQKIILLFFSSEKFHIWNRCHFVSAIDSKLDWSGSWHCGRPANGCLQTSIDRQLCQSLAKNGWFGCEWILNAFVGTMQMKN